MSRGSRTAQGIAVLEELARCSFPLMCTIHRSPFRSLYAGGAGIAYALWRAACLLGEPEWLHLARAWIDQAAAAPLDEPSITTPDDPKHSVAVHVQDSFYLGARGVWFVQSLVAHAEDNPLMLREARKAFTSPSLEEVREQELLQGIAGRLVGCTLLWRETGEAPLEKHARVLAQDLLSAAGVPADTTPWADNHRLGLAHGRAGNFYALLLWAKETGSELPEWVGAGLRQLAAAAKERSHGISWPVDDRGEDRYMDTWCNGAPGFVHLWSLAYQLYHDPLYLTLAKQAGEYCAYRRRQMVGTLCCGAAGYSYAFLRLHCMDPGGPWLDHARRHADIAAQSRMDPYARLGLFRGLAGLACLLLDLENPREARLPALE
jgi:eukaryotic-like serine/threonine-protein kinase